MTKKCIVCQEKFSNSSEYNFHVFPKNEIFRRMWIESLNLQAEAITKNCTVCSKHFDENSYFKTNSESSRRKLRSDAVPQRIISYINIKNEADELSGENIDYEENESENESTSFSKDENSQPVKLNINNEETKLNEHLGFIKNEPDEILLPETVNGSAENVDINNENNFSLYSVYLGTDINTNSSLNIKTESDPLETDITNNESISNTNSRKRQISSERNKWIRKRVSFINGYRKEYICREDFVSEEAWGRFLNYVTYQNARIFVHNQNAEANNKGKTLNKVVKHLEKEKEPTIGTTEGVEEEYKNQREERLKKKREAEKERRAKIRADAILHQNYCQKEKERYERRKQEGKIKVVKQLTVREKLFLNKRQREWTRVSRLKKKNCKNKIVIMNGIQNSQEQETILAKETEDANINQFYCDTERLSSKN